MFIGTAYFTTKKRAVEYYAKQDSDAESVEEYIKEGLICIGVPPVPLYKLRVDEDGRYWRIEK